MEASAAKGPGPDGARIDAIELGSVQRDTVTGFEGTVVGRSDFLTGCAQALLTRGLDSGETASQWVDYPRLEEVAASDGRFDDEVRRRGGPAPTATPSRPAPR